MIAQFAVLLAALAPAAAPGSPADAPTAYLAKMLKDPKTVRPTLVTLHSTRDKDTAAILAALLKSGDRNVRVFCADALSDLQGKDAASRLLERVNYDADMAVRAQALAHLVALKALTTDQLGDALKIPDERIQCLTARALVDANRPEAAVATLERLTGSADPATAAVCRMCLLGLGRAGQEPHLRKLMRDPKTPPAVLLILLRQVRRQRIAAAAALAGHVAGSDEYAVALRALAYQAVSETSPAAAATLREAIGRCKLNVLRLRLLKLLADRDDAGTALRDLAKGSGSVAALARFELARKTGGPTASPAVVEAIDLGHPIVIAYVLDRAGADIKAHGKKVDYYVAALAKYIRSVAPKPARMGKEHLLAAGAASRLIELGTPAALTALKDLLSGKATAVTRSTAAGLLRAANPAAGELARPLLASPYGELATDAALALGHHGDPAAAPRLREILAHPNRHEPALVVLASWYLLKIAKQTKDAADQLAKALP